jgi:hypothetical protein
MQTVPPFPTRVNLLAGGSLAGTALTLLGLLLLWASSAEGIWVAIFLLPILIAATAPALSRQAVRERDRTLLWLLLVALTLKLLGSLVRYFISFKVYGGAVDAVGYHDFGSELSDRFRAGQFDTGLPSLTGTNFIEFLTGVVYTVSGPSIYAGFLLFSWLAFWGMFYLYRAFTIAVPGGHRRSYARLLFFLPSMLYWPSSIGKEAWMLFTLGIAAFGVARVLSGRAVRGLILAGIGLWLAALVRPHVAGMAVLGLAVAFLLGRTQRRRDWRASAVKILAMGTLVVLAALLLSQTSAFLRDQGLDPEDGVNSVLSGNTERTDTGGSKFAVASSGISPANLPQATITILFRPFLFEAHNAQAAITAIESTILLCLAISRGRLIGRAMRSFRRLPYVTFCWVFGALFVTAFASMANFGIIARERTQLLPFFLVLLAVPGVGARRRRSTPPAATTTRSHHVHELAHT